MKSWYESKTIWLGLATIVTAVVSVVAGGAGWQQVSRDTQIPAVSGHPDSRTMTPRGVRCLGASLS